MLHRDDAPSGAERAAFLSQVATGLAEREHLMDGPMPREIEAFVTRYRTPASLPTSPSDQRQAAPSDRNQQQAPDPDA